MKTNSWVFSIVRVKFPIHWKIQQGSNLLAMLNESEVHNRIPDTQNENQSTSHMNTDHPANPPSDGMDFLTPASILFPKAGTDQGPPKEPLAVLILLPEQDKSCFQVCARHK